MTDTNRHRAAEAPVGRTAMGNNRVQWWKVEADGTVVVRHTAFSTASDAAKFWDILQELGSCLAAFGARRAEEAVEELTAEALRLENRCTQLSREIQAALKVQDVAEAFVAYYSRPDGCANCGGLPHSRECFNGKFQAALSATTGDPGR